MSSHVTDEKVKIGGWLIVVGIVLWFGAVLGGLLTITNAVAAAVNPHMGTYINSGMQVLALLAVLVVLVRFHQRKASFVTWAVIYETVIFVEECYHMWVNLALNTAGQGGRILTVVGVFVIALIEIVLIILYVLQSKRVKRTFTR